MTAATETRKFEAEVAQVLHLVTHSLYSHKEIFLRELISNASDACDKLRFEAIANPSWLAGDAELRIDVSIDKDARTLSVHDNGIGMSRDELVANLGTIASSGTRRYLESMSAENRSDSRLIGQFGVGFYSAFVVADEVTVTSRGAGDNGNEGTRWHSNGKGEYSLETVSDVPRGTTVTLHLKEDEGEFLDSWKVRSLVSRYSEHIGFPIRMLKEGEGKPTAEWETVNSASALWTRPKNELKDEDYQNFYKSLSHDFSDALSWTHNRVEGNQNFTSLLFVPAKAPFDFMQGREERKGLKLYIRRVFIMDASEQLLPAYLRFVRGVVDSDDLPLNVSREILQQNRQVERIRGACTKRVLDLLDKLAADDAGKYSTFWNAFGGVLKEGIAEDAGNRERIAKLLRFSSTQSDGPAPSVSLDDYIGRMPLGQDVIWYITADSYAAAKGSPQLEALKAKGTEVLLMSDRIDEWMAGYLTEYSGKKLRHVGKGEIELDAAASEAQKASEEAAAPVVARIKQLLGERVRDVKVSRRLTDSPSCLVLDEYDMALHLRRVIKQSGHEMPEANPTLEINPKHALVKRLEAEGNEAKASDLAMLLLEQAQVAEGAQLEDPSAFVRRMNRILLG
ncbi:MAG: molecular chaperone HtpG [Dokdonella sp.]|jgi:molecular chaperone HtpG|uniref:molecular chaperone HtpG n=1 Tax=Dokdonella sp. TaxID=2291710 RepID=UPI001B5C9795|nr:molecular chaperone HtpG [Dokdonella sp.]MBK8122341.1 molecular chaperone HtpG [Dokdonella sp.]MBP6325879.1 molecular chaperone HtpG [Dokdonella sp.]MBP6328193.1 molecular chaperone HtpG [Dokdonella sp.]HQV48016.1 molecular chaperone HtpG [Dokdonella sp.]HQX33671.1 molecular chaperone HtpG [Dokdonella sp.]